MVALSQSELACGRFPMPSGKSWIFPKISRTWKVLKNEFGPGKWKVLEIKA